MGLHDASATDARATTRGRRSPTNSARRGQLGVTRITDSAASPDHRLPVDPVKSRLARPGSAFRRQLRDSARWAPCTAPGPHPAGSIASAADSPLDMERKIQGAPGRLPRLRTGRSGGAGTAGCRLCTRRRLRLNRPRAARAVHRRRLLTYRVRRLGRTCSALLLFSGFVGAPPLACAQLSAQRHTESAEQGAEAPASEIVTDGPDITEASTVVPYGSLQAENGPVWTTRQHLRTLDGLETRLRFGIARRTEQRLGVPDCFYDRGRPEHASGFGDLIVGAKATAGAATRRLPSLDDRGRQPPDRHLRRLQRRCGSRDQVPLVTRTDGPVVDRRHVVGLLDDRRQSAKLHVGAVVLHRTAIDKGRRRLRGVRGDYFQHGSPQQILHMGAAYRPRPTQQIDFHDGVGLSRAAPDLFVGIGYSFRIDRLLR